MKQYKLRPGVVLTEVCGEYLLVSTGYARDVCPYVLQINEQAAVFWRILEQESRVPAIMQRASQVFNKEAKDVLLLWISFLSRMSKQGYVLTEETT